MRRQVHQYPLMSSTLTNDNEILLNLLKLDSATHHPLTCSAALRDNRDFMHDISVKRRATRQHQVVCGDWPVPWKLCTTVLFLTLALV